MRSSLAALLMLGWLAACAPRSAVRLGIPDDTEPIEATIYDVDWRGVTFAVNQPAHVAVFEIVPERGVSLVFPQYAAQGNFVRSGLYTTPRGLQGGRWLYEAANPFERFPQPRYYLLVASRYPLALGQMVSSPGAVRSLLGWQRFTTRDVYSTMELLSRAIVPAYDADLQGSWTSDVYVVWPSTQRYRSTSSGYDYFRCADGRLFLIPWEALPLDCFELPAKRQTRRIPPMSRRDSVTKPDSTAKPDSSAKPDTASRGPARPKQPAEDEPRRIPGFLLPATPKSAPTGPRIAVGEESEARAPRRSGRAAFDDSRSEVARRSLGARQARSKGQNANANDQLRPADVAAQERAARWWPSETPNDGGVTDSHSQPRRVRNEPRNEPRHEPTRETRPEPRPEPRAEPAHRPPPPPRDPPRRDPPPRDPPPQTSERSKPPHGAR